MYLKTNVPYEDVVEKRYMIEDEVDRNVVSALLKEATSFEALMALGTTSIFDDVMKIIKVEKCVEETFLKPMKEFETIKNIGDYFVRSKFLIIASRPFHEVNEYYTNMQEFARRYNLDERIGSRLLCDKTRASENLFLDNPYIDEELSNIFQTAIFSDSKHYYNSLMHYFDEVWDFVYKDDMEDGLNVEQENLDDNDDIKYGSTQEEVDPDKINMYFYINYLIRLDYCINQNYSRDFIDTKNRLLYALGHYDSNLNNKRNVYKKYESLRDELAYCDREDYKEARVPHLGATSDEDIAEGAGGNGSDDGADYSDNNKGEGGLEQRLILSSLRETDDLKDEGDQPDDTSDEHKRERKDRGARADAFAADKKIKQRFCKIDHARNDIEHFGYEEFFYTAVCVRILHVASFVTCARSSRPNSCRATRASPHPPERRVSRR